MNNPSVGQRDHVSNGRDEALVIGAELFAPGVELAHFLVAPTITCEAGDDPWFALFVLPLHAVEMPVHWPIHEPEYVIATRRVVSPDFRSEPRINTAHAPTSFADANAVRAEGGVQESEGACPGAS